MTDHYEPHAPDEWVKEYQEQLKEDARVEAEIKKHARNAKLTGLFLAAMSIPIIISVNPFWGVGMLTGALWNVPLAIFWPRLAWRLQMRCNRALDRFVNTIGRALRRKTTTPEPIPDVQRAYARIHETLRQMNQRGTPAIAPSPITVRKGTTSTGPG
jgi:hypothetical protein